MEINKDEMRQKLRAVGAKLTKPETLMKRTVFYTGEHSFARVRDEGDKIVMTYKNITDDHSILGTKEVNLTVDDYDNAVLLLKGCGLEVKAVQETWREEWRRGEIEFCIDTWPWLPTFLEIEGPDEAEVCRVAERLGLEKSRAKFGSVDTTYQHYYGIDTDVVNLHTPVINFEMEPPEWARSRIDRGGAEP